MYLFFCVLMANNLYNEPSLSWIMITVILCLKSLISSIVLTKSYCRDEQALDNFKPEKNISFKNWSYVGRFISCINEHHSVIQPTSFKPLWPLRQLLVGCLLFYFT